MKRRAGTEDVRAEQGGDVQNILRKESYTKVRGYTVQKGKIVDSQPKDQIFTLLDEILRSVLKTIVRPFYMAKFIKNSFTT